MVLVSDFGYFDYWSGVEFVKVKMEVMFFMVENYFLFVYEEISECVKEQVKFMFLNYLNNFIGVVVMVEFFEDIVVFVVKYDICVVYDFVYGVIGFDGKKLISFLQIFGVKEMGIEIYIFFKMYNMVGW